MLDGEHARRQAIGIVAGHDRHSLLGQDGSRVQVRRDFVDGDAGLGVAGCQHGAVDRQPIIPAPPWAGSRLGWMLTVRPP